MNPFTMPFELIKMCMHYAYGYEEYDVHDLVSLEDYKSLKLAIFARPELAHDVLEDAAYFGYTDIARLALECGADCIKLLKKVYSRRYMGDSYIDGEVWPLLAEFGLDLARHGFTIMHLMSMRKDNIKMVEMMIKVGILRPIHFKNLDELAIPLPVAIAYDPEYKTHKNMYLACAAAQGDMTMVQMLLKDGADTSYEKNKALRKAVEHEHAEIAALLFALWQKR